MQTFVTIFLIAVFAYLVWETTRAYVAAEGTVPARLYAAFRGSWTIIWARLNALSVLAISGLAEFGNALGQPGVKDALAPYLTAEYMLAYTVIALVGAETHAPQAGVVMVGGILDSVAEWLKATLAGTVGHWVSLDWIPEIFFWYWWLFVLFLITGVIIRFFGWARFVQIGASVLFAAGAVFVAGGHVMSRQIEKRAKKQPPPPVPARPPRDPFQPW